MTPSPSKIRVPVVSASAGAVLILATTAAAVPQVVVSQETPNCDVLPLLTLVDELGLAPPFPTGEQITAAATFTQQSACPMSDLPPLLNAFVVMTNLNTVAFSDVYYVANPFDTTGAPATTITNEDGLVNSGQAFRIDAVGMNQPLVFESQIVDGIFAPGETWHFIIDDYLNSLSMPPDAFASIGVGAASVSGTSSGSIIALPVPEPTAASLGALAAYVLARRRRRD